MFQGFYKKKKNKTEEFEIIKELIQKNISDEMKPLNITLNTKIVDIGIDSIKFINIILGLEDYIKMELEDIVKNVDVSKLLTIGDLVNLLGEIKNKK